MRKFADLITYSDDKRQRLDKSRGILKYTHCAKPLSKSMLAYCRLESWEHASVKFESEFYHFHSRKCNLRCRLPKWRPFCPGGDGLTMLWIFGRSMRDALTHAIWDCLTGDQGSLYWQSASKVSKLWWYMHPSDSDAGWNSTQHPTWLQALSEEIGPAVNR